MESFNWLNLLFILLLLGFCVLPMIFMSRKSKKSTNEEALNTLKKRYAQGEITKDTYDFMKKDIISDEHRVH
jgi:uncharacterized membrane protein